MTAQAAPYLKQNGAQEPLQGPLTAQEMSQAPLAAPLDTPLAVPLAKVLPFGYVLTPEDVELVAQAAQTFAADWRYLHDMVLTAGKAERATTAAELAAEMAELKTPETLETFPELEDPIDPAQSDPGMS